MRPRGEYERWKVILGLIAFLLLMGFVGNEDFKAEQVIHEAGKIEALMAGVRP